MLRIRYSNPLEFRANINTEKRYNHSLENIAPCIWCKIAREKCLISLYYN